MGTEMNGILLDFENPIRYGISRIQFAPHSNNLLVSSWDCSLRLYDVNNSALRLEAPSEAALLNCCFQDESLAFSAGSDGLIRRYELHSETYDTVGKHDDIATHVAYSDQTCQVVTAGMDRKVLFWDTRSTAKALLFEPSIGSNVESMSLSGFNLIVATGVAMYSLDLRNPGKPTKLNESYIDVPVACVSSVPYTQGFAVGSIDGRVALEMEDLRYSFWCCPKSKARRNHLESVNDIVFNPINHGVFVTGDNQGFVIIWDFQSRRRLLELPRFPNSVASLSYNCRGEFLAIASSCTFQEANEREDPPQGLISVDERDSILKVLDEIERHIENGDFVWRTDGEDVHMNIEAALIDIIGEPAKKLHTARSRNDQVLTDFRLWCRDAIDDILHAIKSLQVAIVTLALKNEGLVPGYTHLQRAQLVLLQHLLLAFVE